MTPPPIHLGHRLSPEDPPMLPLLKATIKYYHILLIFILFRIYIYTLFILFRKHTRRLHETLERGAHARRFNDTA